jgi:hypothetical protein
MSRCHDTEKEKLLEAKPQIKFMVFLELIFLLNVMNPSKGFPTGPVPKMSMTW